MLVFYYTPRLGVFPAIKYIISLLPADYTPGYTYNHTKGNHKECDRTKKFNHKSRPWWR